MEITYSNKINYEDYAALRASAGWPKICEEQAMAGLCGSKFVIAAKDGSRTVGVARVLSDGGYIAYLADVLVLPEYQRKGIGKEMVGRLVSSVKDGMKEGDNINFTVFATVGKEEFYKKFGFEKRPSEAFGHGMAQWIVR